MDWLKRNDEGSAVAISGEGAKCGAAVIRQSLVDDMPTGSNRLSGTNLSERRALPRGESVSLSPWLNEMPPSLNKLLSSHEVARLTRRHRWVLCTLALLGRFPKQQRFHGRTVGWAKQDVMRWLAESAPCVCSVARARHRRTGPASPPHQQLLPIRFPRAERPRRRCSSRRTGGRP